MGTNNSQTIDKKTVENPVIIDRPGSRVLLTGNEAIARGAIEAGVQVAASYPGTPASEILSTLAKVAKDIDIYAEWSINETVAAEVAFGAAFTGVRSMLSVKSVGTNLIMDPLMSANQIGVVGGMVIVIADDPGGHNSQNEQDTRTVGPYSELPLLSPSTPQEAKDLVRDAFSLSEELQLPVLIRTVTRLNHSRGDVELGPINRERRKANFKKDKYRFTMMAAWCNKRHKWLHDQQQHIAEKLWALNLDKVQIREAASLGIVADGVPYMFVKEAVRLLNIEDKVATYRMGVLNPVNKPLLKQFASSLKEIMVFEETDPYIEHQIRDALYGIPNPPKILGKLTGHTPRQWELDTTIVTNHIAKHLNINWQSRPKKQQEILAQVNKNIIPRSIALCIGCPHRASYFELKTAVRKYANGKAIYTGDIGCYNLGAIDPIDMEDTTVCMGASIGIGQGMAVAGVDIPVVAIIGDGTFMHTGLPGLISANYNKAKLIVFIMDNRAIAMTGFQPTPATGTTAMGETNKGIDLAELAQTIGVNHVYAFDPYNPVEAVEQIGKALTCGETAVIVSRRECALIAARKAQRGGKIGVLYEVDPEKCTFCKRCFNQFGCPAISPRQADGKNVAYIDPILCVGCSVCEWVCPTGAIHPVGQDNKQ
ncbi:MAG: indolepyruvate ferredoxin oxidoreductase subunit alpha [Candidatus Ranarchaeia archaeon]